MGFHATDSCPAASRAATCGDSVRRLACSRAQIRRRASRHVPAEAICLFWQVSISGHRSYWPVLGRWTARDPIEQWSLPNTLLFVCNQTVTAVDLFGLARVDVPFKQTFDYIVADQPWAGTIKKLFDTTVIVSGYDTPQDKISVDIKVTITFTMEKRDADWKAVFPHNPMPKNWIWFMNDHYHSHPTRTFDDDFILVVLKFYGVHTKNIAQLEWDPPELYSGSQSWIGETDEKKENTTGYMEFKLKDIPYCSSGDLKVYLGYPDHVFEADPKRGNGWMQDFVLTWGYSLEHVFKVDATKDGLRSGFGVAKGPPPAGTLPSKYAAAAAAAKKPRMTDTWPSP